MRRALALFLGAAAALATVATPLPALAADPPASSWQADDAVRAVTVAGGRIFVGGKFQHVRPAGAAPGAGSSVPRMHLAALNVTTGALVSAWNPKANGQVFAIAVAGGRVYVGGDFTSINGKPRKHIAALRADNGKLLPWKPTVNDRVYSIVVGAGGKVFVGGRFERANGKRRKHLAAITSAGKVLPWAPEVGQVFGVPCPPRCEPVVHTMALSPDRTKLYVGGHFGRIGKIKRDGAAALSARSGGVLKWNPDVFATKDCPGCIPNETSRVYDLAVTGSRVYLCGGFWKARDNRVTSFNVLATNTTNGRPVKGFGVGTDGDTPACELQGKILYLGGHFNHVGAKCSQSASAPKRCTAVNSSTRQHVAAVSAATGKVLAWNPAANSVVGVLSIDSGKGGIAFGGYFTRFGGKDQQSIARYRGNPAR
jgi:hypothetical protein